jgi:hypothetical protein
MTRDEFVKAYAQCIRDAMAAHPDMYLRGLDPNRVAEAMTKAIENDSYNHSDAYALKLLMRKVGVKPYTRRNINAWFKENVK